MSSDPTLDLDVLRTWIGRTVRVADALDPAQARRLADTLDRSVDLDLGSPVPPLWHWVYFLRSVPSSDLGPDGHEARGRFLPPVALARRLWAGGRLRFHRPLVLGAAAERTSTVIDVQMKDGRSGPLCFVTVEHQIASGEELLLTERQDLVYTDAPPGNHREVPPPDGAAWSSEVVPSAVQLFRYSALTFNAHRIHYDLRHAESVEGHPALVVHGPLVATLLAGSEGVEAPPTSFAYRAVAPLHVDAPFTIHGRPSAGGAVLWAVRPDGNLAMTAEATW